MSQIELQNIQRIFSVGDEQVHALRDIDLTINSGEYISLMGPSGSGKSTLLNLLGLLDRPSSGNYLLDGRDTTTLNDVEQAQVRGGKIGFVFQSFHLVSRLTARENVELPLMLAGIPATKRKSTEPELILADEPTGNLDSKSGSEVIDILERLNTNGMTLIVVTHDLDVGDRAHRRLKMVDGLLAKDLRSNAA